MDSKQRAWRPETEKKMRADWDHRARENVFYYIASSKDDWDPAEFYASGEQSVEESIRPDMGEICRSRSPARMRVLEIGCGAGRMTRALAGIFGEVHGVDVSGEMIARGRQLLAGVPNVHLHRNSGVDLLVLGDLRFDFAFSFIVFQHIPSQAIIGNYIREVQRVLRPGSLFKFQVQGSSQVIACEEDTWIGAPISPPLAVELAERNGFELLRSEGAEEQYFWLWYFKPSRLQMWRKAAEADGWFEGMRRRVC